MAKLAADPFDAAKEEVQNSLEHALSLLELYKIDVAARGTSARLSQLQEDLSQIDSDINDLSRALKVIEENPVRYAVEPSVLSSRQTFVASSIQTLRQIQNDVTQIAAKTTTREKPQAASRQHVYNRNQEFITGQRDQQQMLMTQQDEQLEELALCAERLNHTAQVINSELHDQQRILIELDEDVDRQQDKLNFVTTRMAKVLKTNNTKKLYSILVLIVVFVLMLLLVLYI